MKRILALLLVLLIATLSACGDEPAAKKKKKKVVVIKKRPQSSQTDTSSDESNDESDFVVDDSNLLEEDYMDLPIITPQEVIKLIKKKTSADIGKNYYRVKVVQDHPGVPGMDAEYRITALDKQGIYINAAEMVLTCKEKDVKINGSFITIPWSVRKKGTLTINLYNKKYPNCTGSYTFNFLKFSQNATFRDDFDAKDESKWNYKAYGKGEYTEPIYRNGKLVFRTENEASGGVQMTTFNKFEQAYGSFSCSMKQADIGSGLAGFWICLNRDDMYIFNKDHPEESAGEIDVVEYMPHWGNRWSAAVHWFGWSPGICDSWGDEQLPIDNPQEFHTYSAVWTPTVIYWYLDGKLAKIYDGEGAQAPESDPMYILLTQIVKTEEFWGSHYDPTEYPYEIEYDWVEAYSIEE